MTDSYDAHEMEISISNNTEVNNGVQNYFDPGDNIKIIDHIDPDGKISLHVASTNIGNNEVAQLLFTNDALKSFKDISYPLTPYDESRKKELNTLMENNSNLFHCPQEIPDCDYIEWSLIGKNLIEKRKQFREQIDLYKTYDNRHHLITKLVFEIINYYLNEYLIHQEGFPRFEIENLKFYFKQAIREQNYLEYFIKAYSLTNNFYHVLNKHLALYILDYFDPSSSQTEYRLINCLVHIVTLLVNHPDINKYTYRGTTYRGLSMTKKDLEKYTIGSHILNRTFVSTSFNRSVAQLFAGNSQQTSAKVSVLLKYITKQNKTAINIQHMSTMQDEQEVLILPFSVFQVKDKIENNPNMSPPVLYEIDLEECEDDEQINGRNYISEPLTHFRRRARKRENAIRLNCLYCSIVLFIIIAGWVLAIVVGMKNTATIKRVKNKDQCPRLINRTAWNASESKNNTKLVTPVPYVAIHHTTGPQCTDLDDCISLVQSFQRYHLKEHKWGDIGYNFVVGNNGHVFEGRGWNHTGSHCKRYNNQSIGIGVIGDFSNVSPSKSILNAVQSLINCGITYGFIQKNYTVLGRNSTRGIKKFFALEPVCL
ncbi:unnamed protein product [Rotaria magnacalcarata]|uniref:NAD(P)(+)--arginine ADP-ribosyltransferase n=3 Tax=Rotaria magnacalcarata TaxID=392030 RepID=A0A816CRP2_9BILA|nr:unnamed protein product [Rotaria magnacalcarata]CAF1626866.1 unnamed protein product [Rotaria magnacalcarata]CAF3843406.1 unnamed protein product [Rotaria magnacalcarata]